MELRECSDPAMIVLDHLREEESKRAQVDLKNKVTQVMDTSSSLPSSLYHSELSS